MPYEGQDLFKSSASMRKHELEKKGISKNTSAQSSRENSNRSTDQVKKKDNQTEREKKDGRGVYDDPNDNSFRGRSGALKSKPKEETKNGRFASNKNSETMS